MRLKVFANQLHHTGFSSSLRTFSSHQLVRFTLPPLSSFARTMMIRHWAPIILDGYAYHGRPQKPRRLILPHYLRFLKIIQRTPLIRSRHG
jgi:hypothetical protein